ncbi:hypothetical protein [Granulicella arctica]|uniref:hypothetical protein n=1 Tax=Granulicella arctica TaxID=940613 RepID=UPI0021E0F769|nr:hypothetical protein [Granulicella arctica]
MILTIDNLDGLGAIDYSACLEVSTPLTIGRTLNAPSRCGGMLLLNGLAMPVRRGRVMVIAENGTILFTGYIATEAVQEYAGAGFAGPIYRTAFNAISDEWLLDKQAASFGGAGFAQASGLALKTLTNRVDGNVLTTAGVLDGRAVGVFEPGLTQSWSSNAATIAATTYAAYRAVDGALTLAPAGTVTHTFSDGDGTLQVAAMRSASIKELANDVTVSGAIEPAAYVSEVFEGDGTTAIFALTDAPFVPARTNGSAYLVNDSFNTGVFNPQVWTVTDPGTHIGFGANGLQMSGGNGLDGQTTLAAIDAIEMGGTLVVEAGSLQLASASDGVICGLYEGAITRASCFAGYNVRQGATTPIATPFLNGVEVGTSYSILPGHSYIVRMRLHCTEVQRVSQSYYAMVDGAVESFGGGVVGASMQIVFELVDTGVSSNTPTTVLYDSAVAGFTTGTPATCIFAAVDAVQLIGSMGYCRITQTGSAWVTGTQPSGLVTTRLIGEAGEGVDCKVATDGLITFYAGRIPAAGEIVTVTYRGRQRAVARLEDAASVAREALGDALGTAAWLGRVERPAARSTMDCESAALAILSFSSSRAAAIAGTYVALNPQSTADIWPGDVLALTANGQTVSVVVRSVTVEDGASSPELLTYRIAFANDWAEGLGLTLSESIATDALLPQTALQGPMQVLANLQQMTVVSVSGTAIQVDSGIAPPAGGGFEVRRRDGNFGPMVDQDLVLRSPVRNFSIPREGQAERYFVRMYDGATPPLYSRVSSAVFTHVPVA